MKKDKIEEQLKTLNPENIQSEVLLQALELHKKRQAEQETERALKQLTEVRNDISAAVNALRAARKQEAAAKRYLEALNEAEEKFHKSGNWSEYVMARTDATSSPSIYSRKY